MHYIRARDGQMVSRDEACMPTGQVRAGYSVRVPILADGEHARFESAFMDRAAADTRITFRDASVTLSDAETNVAVARAKRTHDMRHAYLRDRAPAFTDAQAIAAINAAVATKQATTMTDAAIGIRHAETVAARVVRDAAAARRKMEIRNAWKK